MTSDWIQIQNFGSVSSGCGYNFSKMYPYWCLIYIACGGKVRFEFGQALAQALSSAGRNEDDSAAPRSALFPTLQLFVPSTGFWIRIHFRKVVSTSTGYRFNILNLYPIQDQTDTIFQTCIQSETLWIRFLKLVSNLELFEYDFKNFLYPNPKLSAIL